MGARRRGIRVGEGRRLPRGRPAPPAPVAEAGRGSRPGQQGRRARRRGPAAARSRRAGPDARLVIRGPNGVAQSPPARRNSHHLTGAVVRACDQTAQLFVHPVDGRQRPVVRGDFTAASKSAVRTRTPSAGVRSTSMRALRSTASGLAGKSRTANDDGQHAADQRVVDAFPTDAAAIQGQHQDRRDDGLVGEHHPLADEALPDENRGHSAISAAIAMETAPGPSSPWTRVPIPMPRVTPIIIWMARCARNTLLIDRDTAAAIGAKNGCGMAEHVVREVPGQPRRDRGLHEVEPRPAQPFEARAADAATEPAAKAHPVSPRRCAASRRARCAATRTAE